eukprot:scaffold11238_cov114-Isochrysis_galbana.AAC.2
MRTSAARSPGGTARSTRPGARPPDLAPGLAEHPSTEQSIGARHTAVTCNMATTDSGWPMWAVASEIAMRDEMEGGERE